MSCIYLITPKKISNTIYRQVSDRAQLPDVLKFNVDEESKRANYVPIVTVIYLHL